MTTSEVWKRPNVGRMVAFRIVTWPSWLWAPLVLLTAHVARGAQPAGSQAVELEEVTVDVQGVAAHPVATPLPVYVTVYDERVARVMLHYRAGKRWRALRMKRHGEGFEATLPCDAVEHAGEIAYYVQALDDGGDVVASGGSKADPNETRLVRGIEATAHLPGRAPPDKCEPPEEPGEEPLDAPEADQPDRAAPKKPSEPHVWSSVSVMQDAQVATGSDICSQSGQLDGGYSCFREQGSQYLGTPSEGAGGSAGGFALATTRALAGADVAISDAFSIGARVGYVVRGGGPKPAGGSAFLPLHAEGRLAYWFGGPVYGASGIGPFAFAAGGVGQVDSHSDVTVREDPNAPRPTAQLDNPPTQHLDAWKKSGVGFGGLGAGIYFPLGRAQGILTEARGSLLFPTPGFAFGASLGVAFGL